MGKSYIASRYYSTFVDYFYLQEQMGIVIKINTVRLGQRFAFKWDNIKILLKS